MIGLGFDKNRVSFIVILHVIVNPPPCVTLFAEIINNWKFNLFTNDHQRINAGIKEGGARVVYGKYLLMQTCFKANID